MKRTLAVSLVLCLLVVSAAIEGVGTSTANSRLLAPASDPLAEYPSWDRMPRDEHASGLAVKRAKRLLAEAPDSFETAQALLGLRSATYLAQERPDDALRVIRAIFEKQPESIARTIDLVFYWSAFDRDSTRDYRPALRELLDIGRGQLSKLPRPDAADLAYQLMRMQSWVNRDRNGVSTDSMKAFMQEYAGTNGALRAELDLLSRSTSDVFKRVEALARFSNEHRGTCAAAQALRIESTDVGANMGTRPGSAGADPTERTLRLLEIERQLESKEYARCEPGFSRGPSLAAFASKPAYAPGNIDRLIAAYRDFLKTHLDADAGDIDRAVGYLVTSGIRKLFETKGEGVEGLDRFLADLQKQVPEPGAAQYLRALIYEPLSTGNGPGAAPAPPPQTITLLTDLHRSGSGLYQRKALATLAWLYGFYGDTRQAREYYAEYAREYADSAYAWVAALRAAEAAGDLGDWKAAASEYEAAARTYGTMPVARALGHVYGARALEALNDFGRAKAEYQAALAAWDNDYGARYTIGTQRRARPSADFPEIIGDPLAITPLALESRLAELTRALATPGGAVVEQGRWLLDHGKRKEAAALLGDFQKRFPKSANGPEAQYLAHKARLYDALEMLNVEGEANEAAGAAALESLAREPYDFPVTAAKITRACVLWKQGKQDEASKAMDEALKERVARQQLQSPASPLEQDVAAIRSLLFQPTGGPAYSGARGWNAFSWPATVPPFVMVSAQARVKNADGGISSVVLSQRFPGLTNVLLVSDEELDFFSRMMNQVGGTKKRAWTMDVEQALKTGVMETPNQPIGPSLDVMKFLNRFFPVRQGHWGGWEFLTYPVITEIEFFDAGRTRARARVTIGYSGCDVLLEKTGGTWKATGTTNMWIT